MPLQATPLSGGTKHCKKDI